MQSWPNTWIKRLWDLFPSSMHLTHLKTLVHHLNLFLRRERLLYQNQPTSFDWPSLSRSKRCNNWLTDEAEKTKKNNCKQPSAPPGSSTCTPFRLHLEQDLSHLAKVRGLYWSLCLQWSRRDVTKWFIGILSTSSQSYRRQKYCYIEMEKFAFLYHFFPLSCHETELSPFPEFHLYS